MNGKKPTYEELIKRLAEAEKLIAKIRRGETNTAIGQRDVARGQRDTAKGERDTARSQRNTVKHQLGTAIDQRDIARGQRDTAKDERNTARGQRDTAKGERDTARDERDTAILDTEQFSEAYTASEQNFKNTMDASPLGIRIMTEEGELIYANTAILDICGYKTAQEMAAVPRSELYTPESYKAHRERKKKRKLKEHVPQEYEIAIKRPDGEVRNLQVSRREVTWGGERQFMAMYQDITEHKRAEEALRESEEKFHSIVDHSNDGIVFIQNGLIQYCNSKMLEIGDFTEKEILGTPFINFVAPEHKQMVFDVYSKRLAGKKAQNNYELNLLSKGGRKVYVEVSANLITYKQNQVDIAIIRDVTERKEREQALRNSEERLRSIFSTAPVGIGVEVNRVFVEVNENYCKMVGYSRDELIGKSSRIVFPTEEDYKRIGKDKEHQLAAKGTATMESYLKCKDGTLVDVLINSSPLDPKDPSRGNTFTMLDITERKKVEETLAGEALRRRILIEQSSDGIVILDNNGKVYEANQRFADMLGYPMEELKQLHVFDWEYQYPRAQVIEMIRTVDEAGDHFETKHRRKDGTTYDVAISTNGATFAGQKLIFCVCRDITEQKKMEQAIQESEEKYSKAFLASPVMVAITTTKDGKFVEINDTYTQTTGYSREELIGKESLALNLWVNKQDRIRIFRILKEKGRVNREEFGLRKKNGEIRTLLFSAEPIIIGKEECIIGVSIDITERKLAEEALKESEERYRTTLDNMMEGCQIIGFDWTYLYVNDTAAKHYRHKKEELLGHTMAEIFPRFEKTETYKVLQRCMEERAAANIESEFEYTDGSKGYFALGIEPVSQGIFVLSLDISERKRAEKALKESEERYRTTLDNMIEGCEIIDQDMRYLYVNDAAAQHVRQKKEDMLGRKVTEVFPGIEISPFFKTVRRCLEKHVSENIESEFPFPDGSIGYFSLGIQPAPEGAFVLSLDITERKKAEEEIERERAEIKLILDTSQALIFYKDKDGKLLRVNKAFAEALDIPQEDFVGKTVYDLYSADIAQSMTADDREVFESGQSKLNIIEQYESAAGLRWVRTDKIPVLDKNGKPIAMIGFAQDITASKQAEEALQDERKRLFDVLETLPAMICLLTPDYHVAFANRSFRERFGESQGRHCYEYCFGFTEPCIFCEAYTVLETGKPHHWEVTTPDGASVIDVYDFPFTNVDGSRMILEMDIDITVRKQAEEAIKESEEKFNKAFHAALNLMAIISLDEGRIIDVNQAYCNSTGYSRKELTGHIALELNLWANPEQRDEFYRAIATEGRIENIEVLLRTKTGEIRTFLFSAEKVMLRGTPCIVIGALDITERKLAEQRINYLNLTLRSIRNVSQLITRERDRDKLLQGVCNTLVESRSFYSAWIVLFDESYKPLTHAISGFSGDFSPMLEGFKKGNPPQCVKKARKTNQVIITENPRTICTGCPMITDNVDIGSLTVRLEHEGNIYGVLCASLPTEILVDRNEVALFDEVAADIAFALYNIERQVQYERMEQERLRAAKLESIGTLAGGIAHDFNNLLTGIMGNIGLVKTNISPNDAIHEMLDEAEKAALRARDLTQQLLTFAKGGQPVKKLVKLTEILKESATFALRGSNVSVDLAIPDNLWPIEADEGQISQVINNLVINADEAMPSGGTLKIQAENLVLKKTDALPLPNGNYVHIDITDTGMGISPEHLQRIFEPYFTTKQKGSGLGLTSVYSIVRNHGGAILADSRLNHGSTFHIYLPATKKTTKGGKRLTVKSSGQAGGKVLVMDDEEIIRKMLKNMLSLAGYTAEVSADGAEALEKYQQAQKAGDPFNVVIMDLTIPGGMGGREAVIKLLEIDPNATVIVSSGYATDPIMSEYKKYGFKAVIVKPYSVKTLQETLSGLVTAKKK